MAAPMKAGIPPSLDLTDGYVIQFTALDANTGAVISGVTVANATLLVENVRGGDLGLVFEFGEIEWLHIPDGLTAAAAGA